MALSKQSINYSTYPLNVSKDRNLLLIGVAQPAGPSFKAPLVGEPRSYNRDQAYRFMYTSVFNCRTKYTHDNILKLLTKYVTMCIVISYGVNKGLRTEERHESKQPHQVASPEKYIVTIKITYYWYTLQVLVLCRTIV